MRALRFAFAPRPAPRRFAAAAPRAMIDLRKGHPRLEELPHGAVSRACAAAAADLAARGEAGLPLNYGPARGQRSHLAALAGWLAARYGSRVERSWLMTTNGVSHGLELCAAALTRPGDEILVEAPTYFLAAAIFRDHGLTIRGVAVDAAGVDVDALERWPRATPAPARSTSCRATGTRAARPWRARGARSSWPSRRSSTFTSSPTTSTTCSTGRRARGSRGSSRRTRPTPRSATAPRRPTTAAATTTTRGRATGRRAHPLRRGGRRAPRAVSVGSFTKILSPGLRVGWVEAAPDVVARSPRAATSTAAAASRLAGDRDAVASGDLDAHLDGARAAYAARCAALLAELDAAADVFEPLARPTGGFFSGPTSSRRCAAGTRRDEA
ncbi:2-aminoadipate transaminase [Aureococcus anophagefferens]|nr:2-aminoadipate transaminase [Aureococcus anophagefferens]